MYEYCGMLETRFSAGRGGRRLETRLTEAALFARTWLGATRIPSPVLWSCLFDFRFYGHLKTEFEPTPVWQPPRVSLSTEWPDPHEGKKRRVKREAWTRERDNRGAGAHQRRRELRRRRRRRRRQRRRGRRRWPSPGCSASRAARGRRRRRRGSRGTRRWPRCSRARWTSRWAPWRSRAPSRAARSWRRP